MFHFASSTPVVHVHTNETLSVSQSPACVHIIYQMNQVFLFPSPHRLHWWSYTQMKQRNQTVERVFHHCQVSWVYISHFTQCTYIQDTTYYVCMYQRISLVFRSFRNAVKRSPPCLHSRLEKWTPVCIVCTCHQVIKSLIHESCKHHRI